MYSKHRLTFKKTIYAICRSGRPAAQNKAASGAFGLGFRHPDWFSGVGGADPINRTFASRKLSARLAELGTPHVYVEIPGDKHGAGFDVPAILEHFRTQSVATNPWLPDYVLASKPDLTIKEAGYFN